MSSTKTRLSRAEALELVSTLRARLPKRCYERWTVAGSVRRGGATVGDVEVVVVPAFGRVERSTANERGLFGSDVVVAENQNLLWAALDELVASDVAICKHTDARGRTKWGEIDRRVSVCGWPVEFYSATHDNFGTKLAVRTGPGELSRLFMMLLRRRGYQCRDGFQVFPIGRQHPVPIPDEPTFFEYCGIKYVKPAQRRALVKQIQAGFDRAPAPMAV